MTIISTRTNGVATFIALCVAAIWGSSPTTAWQSSQRRVHHSNQATVLQMAVKYDDLVEIGYSTTVSKPLGVVFGENSRPFFGLRVDEIESGKNGGTAGLKVGDQLLAINGKSAVGKDFDQAMYMLREASDPMDLQLYRGPVRQLYTILSNQGALNSDGDDDEEEEVEEVIMDENYESPVKVPIDDVDDKPLNAGDIFNVFKKIGSNAGGKDEKKKGGLFGGMFSNESIQLDGDDASGMK